MSVEIEKETKPTVRYREPIGLKPEFESELERGLIHKLKKIKNKKEVFVNGKGQRVNEVGELLTKRGHIDKRSLNKTIGVTNKKHWQEVAEKNKNPNVKMTTTVESDSDSEPEFEIELEQPKVVIANEILPESVPKIITSTEQLPNPVPKIITQTEIYIKDQEQKRKEYDDEIFKLKDENVKLKSGLQFNDHLNRISHMSKNVKLKF